MNGLEMYKNELKTARAKHAKSSSLIVKYANVWICDFVVAVVISCDNVRCASVLTPIVSNSSYTSIFESAYNLVATNDIFYVRSSKDRFFGK